jgi:hypothetical protein
MNEKELGEVVGRLEGVCVELKRLNTEMFGNGHPGAVDRLARIETHLDTMVKAQTDLANSLKSLSKSVNGHVNNDKLHDIKTMLLDKRIVSVFVGGSFLLYEVADKVDVWAWIEGLVK